MKREKTIYVVGMGPGAREWIFPEAINAVENSEVLIGARRHLDVFKSLQKETIEITAELESLVEKMKQKYRTQQLSVLASGDPCCFGILQFLQKHFAFENLEVIPGLSSFQYLAAKCGINWNECILSSMHGREEDLSKLLKEKKKIFLLTDRRHTPQYIASFLLESGCGKRRMIVGNNLSYFDEEIFEINADELHSSTKKYDLSVVMIYES